MRYPEYLYEVSIRLGIPFPEIKICPKNYGNTKVSEYGSSTLLTVTSSTSTLEDMLKTSTMEQDSAEEDGGAKEGNLGDEGGGPKGDEILTLTSRKLDEDEDSMPNVVRPTQ